MPISSNVQHILGATTAFAGVPMNIHDGTSQISWIVNLTGDGTATYSVQFTLDNIMDSTVSALWVDSVTAQTTDNVGNITVPVRGIRLNITAVSASSNATFRVLQSGI